MSKAIAVISGKGGVGRTITATNLGVALAGYRRNTVLMDANLTTPHIGIHLGSPNNPVDLHDIVSGNKEVHHGLYMHKYGLKVLPADMASRNIHPDHAKGLANVINTLSEMHDFVIVDSPGTFGDDFHSVVSACDKALVVTNPEISAVSGALKAIRIAESYGTDIHGIVLNRMKNDELDLSQSEVESIMGRRILAAIPEHDSVRHSLKIQHPVVYSHPESSPAKGFRGLAAGIIRKGWE